MRLGDQAPESPAESLPMAASAPTFRQRHVSKPLLSWVRRILPPMSDTEREALAAGSVWWDGELMRGDPDFSKLLSMPARALTAEEQAFLDGPTEELCRM